MGCLLTMLFMVLCYAISWIVTVGLIYLVTLCFGWSFSWLIATGIWIILIILEATFRFKK